MVDDEIKPKSKFSSGINIIIRLDLLWKDTHRHSRDGSFSHWNADLDRIWLELARDISDGDFKEKHEAFLTFDKRIADEGGFNDTPDRGFHVINVDKVKRRNKVYGILMEKQLFLARLENELGKGTTTDDDDDDF